MADLETLAAPAVEKLLQSEPDQLYAQLALRRKAIEDDPTRAGHFDITVPYDAAFAGPLDVLRDFGQSYFNKVTVSAYALVCGSNQENAAVRKKLLKAIGGGATTFAAVLAGVLVSTFSWAPAVAAVVAALVVKLFFKPGYEATCEVWKQHLPASKTPASAKAKPKPPAAKKPRPAQAGRPKKRK